MAKAIANPFPFDVDQARVTILYTAFYLHHFAPHDRGMIITLTKKGENPNPRTIIMAAHTDADVLKYLASVGLSPSEASRVVSAAHAVYSRYAAIAAPPAHANPPTPKPDA